MRRAGGGRGLRLMAAALALAVLLGAGCTPDWAGGDRPTSQNDHLLLAEVYPNGWAEDGSDQFIRLHNPTERAVDLTGWSVGDGKVRATFPPGARIGPRQSLYLGRSADGFRRVMGALPDFAWGAESEGAPALTGGAGLRFGRSQGLVVLRDGAGREVDVLAYGAAPAVAVAGWHGPPAPPPEQGVVIDRARDEATWTAAAPGAYALDTDTAADWKQGAEWVDLRVLRPGQTWFGYPTYQVESVTAYAAPDATYATLTALIDGARESIDLNVYDFTVVDLAERLAAAVRRGVRVRLLMEAGSVGRLYDQERYVAKVVAEAGGQVRWVLNDPGDGYFGRYVFNHAKYGVIDGETVFVQSENLVRHGTAPDPSYGNRGWGAVVADRSLAAYLSRVFEADWSPVYGDVVPYAPGTPFGPPPPDFVPTREVLRGEYPAPFPPRTVRGPVAVTPVLAPDHSLLQTRGIIGLMRSARESLYIEQMYAHLHWGPDGSSPRQTPDLFLREAIASARRGVRVRILLGDAYLDPTNPRDNTWTVKYVNEVAKSEGLDLEARIVDSARAAIAKVHNKGLIVDERKVLVSSVNWSYNSPANNREVSLLIESEEIGAYFADIFTYDWYDGTPADYPLITEVAPGFVEIASFGPEALDLSGWTLATSAGVWSLPDGTWLRPGQPLVVTPDLAAFIARYGEVARVLEVTGLRWNPARDALRLHDGSRRVDGLAWGQPQPPWNLAGPDPGPLCRKTPGKDTNTYLDWTAAAAGTPGLAGCGH